MGCDVGISGVGSDIVLVEIGFVVILDEVDVVFNVGVVEDLNILID